MFPPVLPSSRRFEDKSQLLDQLERQLQRLHDSARQLWEQRRSLAHHTANLSRALALLAEAEADDAVKGALVSLAKVEVRGGTKFTKLVLK